MSKLKAEVWVSDRRSTFERSVDASPRPRGAGRLEN